MTVELLDVLAVSDPIFIPLPVLDGNTIVIASRLLVALGLGAIVGLERELSNHPAGLRTHILVCLGSAVFTVLSSHGLIEPALISGMADEGVRIVRDPARIAAQVVTGIGFIGGGVVLRHGATIRGLTTAASLWMVASIGMLAGSGHLVLAIFSALLAWLVLSVLGKLGHRFLGKQQNRYNRLRLTIDCDKGSYTVLQAWVGRHFPQRVIEVKTDPTSEKTLRLHYTVDVAKLDVQVSSLSDELYGMDGVCSVHTKLSYSAVAGDNSG